MTVFRVSLFFANTTPLSVFFGCFVLWVNQTRTEVVIGFEVHWNVMFGEDPSEEAQIRSSAVGLFHFTLNNVAIIRFQCERFTKLNRLTGTTRNGDAGVKLPTSELSSIMFRKEKRRRGDFRLQTIVMNVDQD